MISTELLNIAESDLEASRVLYENKLYPQAIFYFQQSVEKANKSLALVTKHVTEKELSGNIRHEAIKIHEKAVKRQKAKYEQFNEHLKLIPELGEIEFLENFNNKREIRQFDFSLSYIDEIRHYKNKLIHMSSWDIRRFLKEMEKGKNDVKKEMQKLSNFRMNDKKLKKMNQNFIELYNVSIKYNPLYAEELKNDFDKLDSKNIEKYIEKYIKNYFGLTYLGMSLSISLYCLAIITLPHVSITRYPENNMTPLKIYTPKLPIVKKLPELIDVHNNALNEFKILNKKIREINAPIH